MSEQRVFVNNDNVATFACPKCEKKITMDFSPYMNVSEILMMECRCRCGHSNTVVVERRKFQRREVHIPGIYAVRKGNIKGRMTVKDLSRGGLKFELETKKNVKVGDKLFVKFSLDDPKKTLIKKDVFIRSIFGLSIGSEFCSRDPRNAVDKAYDLAITRYVLHARLV